MKKTESSTIFPAGFYECERGNIWLTTEEGEQHVAWFRLSKDKWLEASVVPVNYPGFQVSIIASTYEELAAHINANCAGWVIRKLNIEGVKVEGDHVAEALTDTDPDSPYQDTSTLDGQRRMELEAFWNNTDLKYQVEHANGWEHDGKDIYSCTVFVSDDDAPEKPTVARMVVVIFKPGKAEFASATIDGDNIDGAGPLFPGA